MMKIERKLQGISKTDTSTDPRAWPAIKHYNISQPLGFFQGNKG